MTYSKEDGDDEENKYNSNHKNGKPQFLGLMGLISNQ